MEMRELASKLGVKNIVVSHINSDMYKDVYTVVINDDLVMTFTGKTYGFVALTENGVGKELNRSAVTRILDSIRSELKDKSF